MKLHLLLRSVRLGVNSLAMHKLRSGLTTLGVLFGTSSVIAMLSIGEGASEEAQEQIRLLGSQNVILRSIKPPENPNSNQTSRTLIYGLTEMDYKRVSETFPGITRTVPVRELTGKALRSGDKQMMPRIYATEPGYESVTGRMTYEGRFITPEDNRRRSNVCVLGSEVARTLFPFEPAMGKRVRIGAEYFRVVGTLLPRMPTKDDPARAGLEVTGEVFLPLETATHWFGVMQVIRRSGSTEFQEVELHEIIAEVGRPEDVPLVASAAREMLARNHRNRDYEVLVPLELLARAEETKRIFNIVLGSIAGISLLVGGIGIMNVMLATVTERTREIGIRRALGARRRHIVTQFLVETVVLSVGGGILGVLFGIAIPLMVEQYADLRTVVTPAAPLLAFGISVLIGVVFGLYPAWRAATMDPVEALRHE